MPARVLTLPGGGRVALPDVTLVAVSDVALAATARALAISQAGLRFAESLLLTSREPPPGLCATLRTIEPITSREAYSRFMLRDLHRHIATSHALCVQWDGYVLDPARWDREFLEYDYIGAPWPHFGDAMRVGNGGFSLRSRSCSNFARSWRSLTRPRTLPFAAPIGPYSNSASGCASPPKT